MKIFLTCVAFVALASIQAADQATFRAEEIDTKIAIGYGLAIADVDGDGKQDVLLADQKQFVWYQNPKWTKHVLAENLTPRDNVCIAAADIDGDGKAEVAVGADWAPADTVNSGALFYLVAPADRTQPWEAVKLPHEPTIHRIKWAKGADGKYGLVSIPLHGRGNKNGEGAPVKHEFYHVPKDVKTEWKRMLINEDLHMSHNFDVLHGNKESADELFIAGKEGINFYNLADGSWKKRPVAKTGEQGFAGAGEVRNGWLPNGRRFLAAIEPMHGTNVVVYSGSWKRTVLDSSLNDGHAVAVGDFLAKGSDQFLVGWRGKGPGVKMFVPDAEGSKWTQQPIDMGGMACEDLAVGDLNGDGKPDLVAAGRATKNVKIYWNETR